MEETKNNFLANEPVGGLMRKLILPSLAAQLINLAYNVVDRVYVGHMQTGGTEALAGLGVVYPLVMLISAFAQLMAFGGATRAAILLGKKDTKEAEKILGSCFFNLILASVVLIFLLFALKKPLILFFGASEGTFGYADGYFTYYLLGTGFTLVSLGMNLFITAQGYTKYSMITICIGAALNIVLDPLFIYVLNGGVQGAAIATVISQAVSAVWAVAFFFGSKTVIRLRRQNVRPEWELTKLAVGLGVSPFIMQSTDSLVQILFNKAMFRYGGDDYVTVMSVFFSLIQFVWLPLQGFSQGTTPIISYNYGAGNIRRVKEAFQKLLTLSLSYSMILVLLMELLPGVFIGMFSSDANIIALGENTCRILMAGMAVMGIQSACQQTFLALGQTGVSLFLALLRKIFLQIPLLLLLPGILGLGVTGVCLAESVGDICAVTVTGLVFYRRFPKIIQST